MSGVDGAPLDPSDGDRAARMTRLLTAATHGDADAVAELPALLYDELRAMARRKLAGQPAGQTLQATALVHEAWLRLAAGAPQEWQGRAHFFGAAARAMRNILVDRARRRARQGDVRRVDVDETPLACPVPFDDVLAVDEALAELERMDPGKARLVMLRFFTGLSMPEVAELQGMSLSTAEREWRFARSWLQARIVPPGD